MDFPVLAVSCKRNCTACGLAHLAPLSCSMRGGACIHTASLFWWSTSPLLPTPQARVLGGLILPAVGDNAAVKVHAQVFVEVTVFISLGHVHRNGMAESYGSSMSNLQRACAVTHSGRLLRSHQGRTKATSPTSSPACFPVSAPGCHSGRDVATNCGFDFHLPPD